METTLKKLGDLNKRINSLVVKKMLLEKELEEHFLKMDKVEGLAAYIKYKGFNIGSFYNCFGSDIGDCYRFGDIRIKVVYNYGYTDIEGLTEEEFKQFRSLLKITDNEEDDE